MATLIVERKRGCVDRFRTFQIFLDGEKVHAIANGEQIQFDIEKGKHMLAAKIDWYISLPVVFDIEEEETLTFLVHTPNLIQAIFYAFSNKHKYLTLKIKTSDKRVR